jgi:phosphohistidine phosphatase
VRLILIRHAEAVERGTSGVSDEDRPLTSMGERRYRKAARGLARVTGRPDLLLTSPLPRARRTAEIAAKAWGRLRPVGTGALATGDFEELGRQLIGHDDECVALVGHEPHLSSLLAWLLGARAAERLAFGKGGAAVAEAPRWSGGSARLICFLPPRILRRLGRH